VCYTCDTWIEFHDCCSNSQPRMQVHYSIADAVNFLISNVRERGAICTEIHHIYLNARQGFSLKVGTEICEVVLNLPIKHQTGLLWTGPHGAYQGLHCQNHVRSAVFWDITQCRMVTVHRCFGTTYQPISPSFKGQDIQKRKHSTTEVYRHSLLLWAFVHRLIS